MSNSSYKYLGNFGNDNKSNVNNPLTYCMYDSLDSRFMHGGHSDTYGPYSRPCQLYMAQYCAEKWDDFCELASRDVNASFPDSGHHYNEMNALATRDLTAGEILIYNTATRKYLVKMNGGDKKFEPFDPTVPTSPMISYWIPKTNQSIVPEYAVDPKTIDQDVVMNKILDKPSIAVTLLVNIYNTMKRNGTLHQLRGTRLGGFYNNTPYFQSRGGV